MDIGTAKPSAEVLSATPHFLVDIIDPAQHYSAWDFVTDTKQLIEQISQRGNIPLLVGGTMMYYHALEQGLNRLPMADQSVRDRLNSQAEVVGWPAMHQKLEAIDSVSAEKIKPNDSQRIQRALEVFEISGQTLSSLQQTKNINNDINATKFILNAEDRPHLHKRIEQRFHQMIKDGLIEEVEQLKKRTDLNLTLPSMRCVGYRQVWQYLSDKSDQEEMIFKSIVATRQLAKRQMTWLRKQTQQNSYDCLKLHQKKTKDAIYFRLSSLFL
jgi:tRNA dimethylallyltransferase